MSRRTRIDSARLFLRAKTIRPAVARADSSAMQATSYCLFGGDDLNGSQLHNARDWRPMSLYSVREYGRSPRAEPWAWCPPPLTMRTTAIYAAILRVVAAASAISARSARSFALARRSAIAPAAASKSLMCACARSRAPVDVASDLSHATRLAM